YAKRGYRLPDWMFAIAQAIAVDSNIHALPILPTNHSFHSRPQRPSGIPVGHTDIGERVAAQPQSQFQAAEEKGRRDEQLLQGRFHVHNTAVLARTILTSWHSGRSRTCESRKTGSVHRLGTRSLTVAAQLDMPAHGEDIRMRGDALNCLQGT